jgi:hypothetical protein
MCNFPFTTQNTPQDFKPKTQPQPTIPNPADGAQELVADDAPAGQEVSRQRTESHDSTGSTEAHLRLYRTGSFDMETVTANDDGTNTTHRVLKSGGRQTTFINNNNNSNQR